MKTRARIGIIGLGRLGSALARGLARNSELDEILGFNRTKPKADELAASVSKLKICESEAAVIERSDVVFLWTKPADAVEVFERCHRSLPSANPVVASCMWGVPLSNWTKRWAETLPNVNMAVGRGVTLISAAPDLDSADRSLVRDTLALVGSVHEVPVEDLPFYSALCSCGPALYAFFLETMAQVLGEHRGYDSDLCTTLVRQTVSGTLALQDQEGVSAAEVIRRVAHPGGSTEAGITVLRAQLPTLIEKMLRNMKKW